MSLSLSKTVSFEWRHFELIKEIMKKENCDFSKAVRLILDQHFGLTPILEEV